MPNAMAGKIKIFISHAHRDEDIAEKLVTALELAMSVPDGSVRCTSVPGYKLDFGSMPPDILRSELASAESVVAILTPHSLASEWVAFELGAAWLQAKRTIPLLAGLRPEDVPGPMRGAAAGLLNSASSLYQFLDQLAKTTGWLERNKLAALAKLEELAAYVTKKSFLDEIDRETKASFSAKRARVGERQGKILDYIASHSDRDISQGELQTAFNFGQSEIYYRLETLRYLGFLTRRKIGENGGVATYGWTTSDKYRAELE
ncbi:TIR domain-containing protein [Mesorhizobium sp. GbtcB19]|uniref:TIR domain-containing protein n=1 Tax=Mesorhizobium sp. GbtcB19 TaxID=2824764 RepID=UPI001C304187|nr:toll/interleukin-1 receptor domain-containing protein [Mesorhizobium sp. GbtcB19]